jgi:hypothetical protein
LLALMAEKKAELFVKVLVWAPAFSAVAHVMVTAAKWVRRILRIMGGVYVGARFVQGKIGSVGRETAVSGPEVRGPTLIRSLQAIVLQQLTFW